MVARVTDLYPYIRIEGYSNGGAVARPVEAPGTGAPAAATSRSVPPAAPEEDEDQQHAGECGGDDCGLHRAAAFYSRTEIRRRRRLDDRAVPRDVLAPPRAA
jgi:hypothetical protein